MNKFIHFLNSLESPDSSLVEAISKGYETVMLDSVNSSFTAYHGTPKKIDSFVDDFVGGNDATDQNGPGIYFTTKVDETYGYAGDGYVYHVKISNSKFLDSIERSKSYLSKYRNSIRKLIKMAPDWEMAAQNWDPSPQRGLSEMVDNFIEYNTSEADVFLQVWIDVYRGIEVEFVRNMVKLGYGGLFISGGFQSGAGGDHIVVYDPKLIEVIKVESRQEEVNERAS